ncbi:MAG: hypothetical protein ACRDKS_18270, partial [Actinomycetota bacterium]
KNLLLALDVFAKIGVDRKGELAGIIGDFADVQNSFNSTREDFVRAKEAARSVLARAVAHKDDLKRTVENARSLGTEIIALLDHRKKELNQILADLGDVIRIAHARQGDVDKLLTYLGPFLADAVAAFDAPYFVFNLLGNGDAPSCSYDPSSRPARAVDDTAPKESETDFECAGGDPPEAETALPAWLRVKLARISWLELLMLGF